MKKILKVSVLLMALAMLFTSCASKEKGESGPSIPHPREYVFDPIDAGEVWSIEYNQYGPNYQSLKTNTFYPLVKKDKPLAGDTVTIKMKFVSDIDLPCLIANLTDQSAAANYWTLISAKEDVNKVIATDIKAGVPVEVEYTTVLSTDVKGDFTFVFVYDTSDQPAEYPMINAPAKFTFERVCESTNTNNEVVEAPHVPTTYGVDLAKYAAFCQIETNHPWIDGQQDMSVISNYQAVPDVTAAFNGKLPLAGDKIDFMWMAVSDIDIKAIHARVVDKSAEAGWWKELEANSEGQIIAENVKAGEPFTATAIFDIANDAVGAVAICIWYDVGDAEGPAICKFAKGIAK